MGWSWAPSYKSSWYIYCHAQNICNPWYDILQASYTIMSNKKLSFGFLFPNHLQPANQHTYHVKSISIYVFDIFDVLNVEKNSTTLRWLQRNFISALGVTIPLQGWCIRTKSSSMWSIKAQKNKQHALVEEFGGICCANCNASNPSPSRRLTPHVIITHVDVRLCVAKQVCLFFSKWTCFISLPHISKRQIT